MSLISLKVIAPYFAWMESNKTFEKPLNLQFIRCLPYYDLFIIETRKKIFWFPIGVNLVWVMGFFPRQTWMMNFLNDRKIDRTNSWNSFYVTAIIIKQMFFVGGLLSRPTAAKVDLKWILSFQVVNHSKSLL